MAIVWGGYAQALRVGVDVYILNPPTSSAQDSVTVRTDWWVAAYQTYSDNQVLNYSGDAGGSTNFFNNRGAGNVYSEFVVATTDHVVPIYFGSTSTRTYRGDISGAYNGAAPWSQATIAIPARPIQAPAAPSAVAVSRVSDAVYNLSWTNNPSSAGPYMALHVQRNEIAGEVGPDARGWGTIAVINGGSTAFQDTGLIGNRTYWWRVVSANDAGTGYGAESEHYSTTPNPPTACTAVKTGSNISVTWARASTLTYVGYDTIVEESQNGGAWAELATVGTGVNAYTHGSPSTLVTHRYRVRHRITYAPSAPLPAGYLYSDYSTSGTVQLLAPPAAPSNFYGTRSLVTSGSPAPNTVFDADATMQLRWTHTPVDTTAQTQYEINYRIVGAPSWTVIGPITSSLNRRFINSGTLVNGNVYEFRVRTRGQHADFGPWSETYAMTAKAAPIGTLNYPPDGGTHAEPTLTIEFAYFSSSASPQVSYTAWLFAPGAEEATEIGYGGAEGTHTFATRLPNGSSWEVSVSVTDSDGLPSNSALSSATIDVVYALPPTPTAVATWDADAGTVALLIANPTPVEDETDATGNDVYRTVDGVRVKIATNVAPNSTVLDPIPGVGVDQVNVYEVIALTALPSEAASAPIEVPGLLSTLPADCLPTSQLGEWCWISSGPSFGTRAKLRGSFALSAQQGRTKVLRSYAGREFPVEYSSDARAHSYNVSGTVESTADSTPAAFVATQEATAPACYRDQWGRRLFVSLGPITSSPIVGSNYSLSFTMTTIGDGQVETEGWQA